MDMDPKAVSSGSCKDVCIKKKYTAMGLHVDQCQCGDWYPPESDLVDDEKCDFQCPAYGDEACGGLKGKGYWSVFNLGISMTVQNIPEEEEDDDSSTTTSAAATSSAAAETSASEATSEPTESEDPQSDGDSSDDGPNVGAIAAGVVVGVVAVGAGIGGLFFWMRRRRNSEIEEEHRRNAAVNAFISGSKPPGSSGSISMTDSRLDPVMAHRRLSDGSIADNEDYSRKILRVNITDPYIFTYHSNIMIGYKRISVIPYITTNDVVFAHQSSFDISFIHPSTLPVAFMAFFGW